MRRRCAEVKVQGTSIPFHHPDTEPYKYLGVWVTPTMNWSHNLVSVLEEFRDRAAKLSISMLSSRKKMKAQAFQIKAGVTYSFPLGILTEADLAQLDGMNARLCKKMNGLSNSAPAATILADRDKTDKPHPLPGGCCYCLYPLCVTGVLHCQQGAQLTLFSACNQRNFSAVSARTL